ncbi:MAG: diheme cytochrome c [Magnetococcales bacterium]|nr:diheme cytochrome c [Magnetococcales bacterium]MBF0114893.1 diheme cytochrome c [Magnetococcales bacterium]
MYNRCTWLGAVILLLFGFLGYSFAGDRAGRPEVAPVENALYRAECGSCHLAYPPGLLPSRSWDKLLSGLADHFGENAEVPEETRLVLHGYLTSQGADQVDYRRSRKIAASIPAQEIPLRISDTPYFRHEHGEQRVVKVAKTGQQVALSRCELCHPRAEQGSFQEHELRLPSGGH